MLGGGGSAGGEELLTVTVVRDEQGYGMKVSGDNPVYVQSVKEHGAAWRAGLRAGDRILRVDGVPVHHHTHQEVVLMIKANPSTVMLTVFQPPQSPIRPPITAPQPVTSDKQRQLDFAKVNTVRMMLEQEKKHISELKHELSKVPDMRKQTQLESSERRCAKLQREIDTIVGIQPTEMTSSSPGTPRLRHKPSNTGSPPSNTPNAASFLSGLPRSLSNLTGQSLRNLRQRQTKIQQENTPPLVRQNSDETNNKRRHNNTVPIVPTTCLDNVTPPPLPPRSIRNPLAPNTSPINPLAKPRPGSSVTNVSPSRYYPNQYKSPMHQSMPSPQYREDRMAQFRRSSHSLDGDLEGPQPNSIALQMSYPLVNAPPPPLQMDNRGAVPVLHVRSQSSPEHLDHGLPARPAKQSDEKDGGLWERGTPPPGTPPPPYAHNTQPCADPQRAIISMEEDDSPGSDNSTYSGLFSNLRSVRESKARVAVLLNWLLGERRCACANLLLLITDSYRSASGVSNATLRRWAYEIQSSFLMPNAVLQLSGVDENMANEIEHVLSNEYDKDELLRNVFRKARQKAKEELTQQLTEFQVKRQVGLGTLYGPEDAVIEKCDVDKQQELTVVETVMCQRLRAVTGGNVSGCGGRGGQDAHSVLLAALICAAHCLQCRPASVMSAVGGARASFLQRDKLYKQRVKQLTKLNPQPFVVRGHHLQLQALTSVAHCHLCDLVIWGLAPQAAVCTDCNLRVHRACARAIEEPCCLDGEHHNNRISRFMERIHHNNQLQAQDSHEKKSRKSSGTANFLNMERSMRKVEDETTWEHAVPAAALERRDESDESLYESADCHSDAISASDDALPRLSKTPTISKESLKLAITDEEVDVAKVKKGHRKAMSLSNPLEMVKSLDWLDAAKKDIDKNCDKKSRESLWSEEDRDSIHGSTLKLDQVRKNSKKGDKSEPSSRKSSTNEQPKLRKPSKASSVSALNLFRRKKTPALKPVEAVVEMIDKILSIDEIVNYTKFFLEEEKRHSSLYKIKPREETDSDEDLSPTPRPNEHRRRLSRQTSRSKSKVRGKSQSVKVNTLRKSHSGTLKKNKKKGTKTPIAARSRQTSIVEVTPLVKKKKSEHTSKQTAWLFSSVRGESRREGSSEEPAAPDGDQETSETREQTDKDNSWRTAPSNGSGRGVNRAESCRERDAPRRGKHRNASDPNRLTAHNNHDLEPSAGTAPSGSSSSSSLSSRSNESNTVAADQQASQSDWSEEDEPLAAQWADSLPPQVLDSLLLSSKLRKRQEVIHELIVSEGSHVRWLKVLGGVFLRPLESQPALLPPDELRALFPNLPQVRERHGRLYADLRNVRANNHIVQIRPVADAVLSTLGESGYAACLSRFCRGQRMALEALRERRRKNKELHQFLAAREQLPLCGRLQLRDLLACVWQRLTKYQLLLESILATVSDSDHESEEDVATLKCALNTAKDVLHSVDTAIRTAENQHRLRSIQSKLEVRASGAEWEELRRLDLTQHNLRMEGELNIRNDSNKKITVLALMLDESLVLLQRESDKFILKPIPPPSQQGLLSPLIRWEKVLFRQNAAVRNTFLLVNINGVQMHELSANTQAEYGTWVKYIQDAPLAHLKHTPAVTHRAPEEIGTNVSRNPSDASEKSEKSEKSPTPAPVEEKETERAASVEPERDGDISVQRSMNERREEDREVPSSVCERDVDRSSVDRDSEERERNIPRRPTVGRISTHGRELTAPLEPSGAVRVNAPVAASCAQRVYTHDERLRRLDGVIATALRAKSAVVAELVGATVDSLPHLAEMAVAETLGQVDVSRELRATRLDRSSSTEEELPDENVSVDMHQLLLAAYSQANQLTEALSKAITVSPAGVVAARARSGLCDSCRRHRADRGSGVSDVTEPGATADARLPPPPPREDIKLLDESSLFEEISDLGHEVSFDMLEDLPPERGELEPIDGECSASALASRLVGLTTGLQGSLGALLSSLPRAASRSDSLRRELLASTETNHALRARLRSADYQMKEEISVPKDGVDETIQDQPSNGG